MAQPVAAERKKISRTAFILAGFTGSLLLYTLAFPNFLFDKGVGWLGWIALSPLFSILPELRTRSGIVSGFAFGTALYAVSNYWLWVYHPAALVIACLYAAFFLAILFPLLTLANRAFPGKGYLAYPFLWLSYEFLRSRGFMGYPYGVLGYAFWRNANVLGLASLGGVWLVSFAALWVNVALGESIRSFLKPANPENRLKPTVRYAVIALGAGLLFTLVGASCKTGYEPRAYFRAILVQPNFQKRQKSIQDYKAMAERLVRLTERARIEKPDLIVWHETAIVPPLGWHLRFRPNRDTLDLVIKMNDYIRSLDVPLLFGNGRAEPDASNVRRRMNWNSAFLFVNGQEAGRYDKMRLVPYSETFPLKDTLPGLAARIEAEVGQFWEEGRDISVFHVGDANFSAPICFEDSFGDQTRAFAAAGADFLVVLTDDSWGRAASCQYHHLTQSALRAAELGIPIARAANTGATVLLGPDGQIISERAPFTEGLLPVAVPLPPAGYAGTVYRKIGDVVGWAALAVSAACIALAVAVLLHGSKAPKDRGRKNKPDPDDTRSRF